MWLSMRTGWPGGFFRIPDNKSIKIYVFTDLSSTRARALRLARDVAWKARQRLLHVVAERVHGDVLAERGVG